MWRIFIVTEICIRLLMYDGQRLSPSNHNQFHSFEQFLDSRRDIAPEFEGRGNMAQETVAESRLNWARMLQRAALPLEDLLR